MKYSILSITRQRYTLLACCGALIAAVAAPAARAEGFPQPPANFDWNGFYIGANLGPYWSHYDFGSYHTRVNVGQQLTQLEGNGNVQEQVSVEEPISFNEFLFFNSGNGHHSDVNGDDLGLTGGGQIGFNKVFFQHFLIGVEGVFDGVSTPSHSTHSSQFKSVTFFDDVFTADTTEVTMRKAETQWNGTVMTRLGYVTGPFLFYGLGGAVFSDVTAFADDRANTNFFFNNLSPDGGDGGGEGNFIGSVSSKHSTKDESILVGWTAGGGVEYAITQICSMGLEFRHNGFGSHTFHFSSGQGPLSQHDSSVDVDSDQLTFKVNLFLGHLGH